MYDVISEQQPVTLSILDLRSGYFAIPLDPASRPKTCFVAGNTAYEFKRLCFGLSNAVSHFSKAMINSARSASVFTGLC
jgi:hypothetical protein